MKPVVLAVLDGYGLSAAGRKNAVADAKTPALRRLFAEYPYATLEASGEAVGLPPGVMGNSEVGHLCLGAGRIVLQDLARIDAAIEAGGFFENAALKAAAAHVREQRSWLHLMGLLSDGGVHAHVRHLYALLDFVKREGLESRAVLHLFLDGRDMPPQSAERLLHELARRQNMLGLEVPVATLIGRYYAMDRDNRWEREHLAYDALVNRAGAQADDPFSGLAAAYARGETDEFVKPVVIGDWRVTEHDAVVFFNFRSDRARELTRAFVDGAFGGFQRPQVLGLRFVCLTEYDPLIQAPVAFPPPVVERALPEALARASKLQLHIAETEKYAHVTYFFNGGKEKAVRGEARILIPSPKVPTYDLKPEMSAQGITDALLDELEKAPYDFAVVNFANADMVGHTGSYEATLAALEALDGCISRIADAVLSRGGALLITADHGNAEVMEEDGHPCTSHTTNPVPVCLVSNAHKRGKLRNGLLADVAPTVLDLMGLEKPEEMTGTSLLIASG